ncbi:hypothetical protein ILYODFUR_019204, partial [Ilyodon furcidens]
MRAPSDRLPKPQPLPEPEPTSEPAPQRYFWRKGNPWEGITVHKIQSLWPGVRKVDAAYENDKQNTVIFFEELQRQEGQNEPWLFKIHFKKAPWNWSQSGCCF